MLTLKGVDSSFPAAGVKNTIVKDTTIFCLFVKGKMRSLNPIGIFFSHQNVKVAELGVMSAE